MPLLLSLLGVGRSWVSGAVNWAFRNPAWALCAALLLANWLTLRRADHWEARDARDAALVGKLRQESDDNAKAQLAQKVAYEAKYKEQADEADRRYHAALADSDSRVADYILHHRVRLDQGGVSASGAAPADHGAQGGNGSGGSPDMVAVLVTDFNTCTINTKRLQEARDWGLGLNAKP